MRPFAGVLKVEFLDRVGQRWTKPPLRRRLEVLQKLSTLFDQFHQMGLADPHFSRLLARGSHAEHHQRLAEMLLAKYLWVDGFSLTSASAGPDFNAAKNGHSVWIELVTPEPKGIDPHWLNVSHQEGVWTYPHEAIALRYTSALKEKHQKLVGDPGKSAGYLAKGVVLPGESYVVAINQHLLQGAFRSLNGISQAPVAGEVVYAIGPQQLHLSRSTGQALHSDHAHRPSLSKAGQAGGRVGVPADSFLNPAYDPVSAVWALDLQEAALLSSSAPHFPAAHLSAVIHNERATSRVLPHLLPAQEEWIGRTTASSIELCRL